MIRPETVELLDRIFGGEANVDDALAGIENALDDLLGWCEEIREAIAERDEEDGATRLEAGSRSLAEMERNMLAAFREAAEEIVRATTRAVA